MGSPFALATLLVPAIGQLIDVEVTYTGSIDTIVVCGSEPLRAVAIKLPSVTVVRLMRPLIGASIFVVFQIELLRR